MNRNRFLIIVIAVLVGLNLFTLFRPMMKGNHRRNGHKTPAEIIVEGLKFNPDQQKAFDLLKKEHQQMVRPLQDSLRFYRDELYSDKIFGDSIQSGKAIEKINEVQHKIESETLLHFQKVFSICTPEQQKNFLPIIREAVKIMGGPPPPRH